MDCLDNILKQNLAFNALLNGKGKMCIRDRSKDSMILDVALNYVPENADIQQIRFVDEKIDGVIDYDIVPSIKVAPMNAQSKLVYSSSNDDIASFKDGTLQFIKPVSYTHL